MNEATSGAARVTGVQHQPLRSAKGGVYRKNVATGNIQMSPAGFTALVIAGGLTKPIALPASSIGAGANNGTRAH
jgi:hypothetical protein